MWAPPPLQPPVPVPPIAMKPPPRRRSVAVYNIQNREEKGQAVIKLNGKAAEKKELEERRDQLSGADILMALGKAAVQKAKKKKETKKVSTRGKINQESRDFSKVRPLCIKPEWSDRLQELENRLEQLVHM